jgi:hypothetical protein
MAGSRPDQIHRRIVSSDLPARLAACLTVSSCVTMTEYYNDYYYNIKPIACAADGAPRWPRWPLSSWCGALT